MNPFIEFLINNALVIIPWLISAIVGAIAVGQYKIIKDILELSQDLAILSVLKGRVTADGLITTSEGNQVINAVFEFLTKLEKIIGTYILNRPETGWIKGYVPEIIEELAESKEPDNSAPAYVITPDANVAVDPTLATQNQSPNIIPPSGAVTA